MTLPPASCRVFGTGVTGSGKSHFLRNVFMPRYSRLLVIDAMGEHAANPIGNGRKVYVAHDVAGTLNALRRAPREGNRWQIIANIDARDVTQLAQVLVPPVLREGAAYPLHVGGMALVCDEVDLIAGSNAPPERVGLWRRSRHTGLSILAATQRPHGVSRLVTAMSQYLVICKTHEPNDVEYLRDIMPAAAHRELLQLTWQWSLLVETATHRWWLLDRDRRTVRSGGGAAPAAAG
jgi:hypothetical protein